MHVCLQFVKLTVVAITVTLHFSVCGCVCVRARAHVCVCDDVKASFVSSCHVTVMFDNAEPN